MPKALPDFSTSIARRSDAIASRWLSRLTGTASTEADEFREIYKMEVVEIPTNEPMVRADGNDLIYKTEKAKFKVEAAEWLKAKGAEPGNPEAYCKIGEEEIAKGTLAGSLLRSTK